MLEARRLVRRSDVALHRAGIGADKTGRAAQKFGHRFARLLAAQIPDRGINPRHRPAQVRAGKLVLALGDEIEKVVKIGGIPPQNPRRDLTVQHLAGDVGMIGRNLPHPCAPSSAVTRTKPTA